MDLGFYKVAGLNVEILAFEGGVKSYRAMVSGDIDVAFCHRIGLDYVSCSPYRVPIARLAAAQAALAEEAEKES